MLGYLSVRFLPSSSNPAYLSNPRGYPEQSAAYRGEPANWADDTGTLSLQPVKREYILHRDIQSRVGNMLVTYRGMESKSQFKLDVIILELDPYVTYARKIDIARAKNGFMLGDESFELKSARKLRLSVWHYD